VHRDVVIKEINDNREFLEPLLSKKMHHFCYPSGFFDLRHLRWLKELNIVSGTTTHSGFNDNSTDRLLLNRFLDSDSYSELLFDGELSGMLDILRKLKKRN
jgi:hypothetical protein